MSFWSRNSRAHRKEVRECREGGKRCHRCQDMIDRGLNPYTGEPLQKGKR